MKKEKPIFIAKSVWASAIAAALILLILVAVILYQWIPRTLDTNDYKSYICYDRNFIGLQLGKDYAKPEPSLEYRAIKNDPKHQFVCVRDTGLHLGGGFQHVIFQDPTAPLDIWSEWTVRKIDLYSETSNPSDDKREQENVLASTAEVSHLTAIKTWNLTNDTYAASQGGISIPSEYPHSETIYLRVYFNESKSIAWDAKVTVYSGEEASELLICLWKSLTNATVTEYLEGTQDAKQLPVKLDSTDALYAWISETFDSILAES